MAKFQTFKDLNVTFKPHPVTGDLIVKKDDAAIKQAVVNLLLTTKGERPFQPDLGSNLRNLLFENLDVATAAEIGDDIRQTLDQFEPRITVTGLEVDANFDDMEELDARLRALMRRKPSLQSSPALAIGALSFNRSTRQLKAKDGDLISLPRRELAAFECLFDRQNTIVSKAQLADHIYGVGADIDENVVEIYVSRLRKKLIGHGVQIKAARGLGYMMDALK